MDLSQFKESQLIKLIDNRWDSSSSVFDIVKKSYESNLKIYKNQPEWASETMAIKKRARIRANRIFRDMESVINALIANPPQPNVVPTRDDPESKQLAMKLQKYFLNRYRELNVKEQMRKGYRNLYFGRLIVLKPFWNSKINDFDVRSLDPRKIRVGKSATKEDDSEFVIEEVTDNLFSVITRFPKKKNELLEKFGYSEETEAEAYINNPDVTYKEAWIGDYVICTYGSLVLSITRNPYWDWDGLIVTRDEHKMLREVGGEKKKNALLNIRLEQAKRKQQMKADSEAASSETASVGAETEAQMQDSGPYVGGDMEEYEAYYFNHFDHVRKPYIFATILNNENSPIGQTDFIEQAAPLQEGIDRRKQDIDENASLVNGQIKVDSSVMSKADAQKLRYEARGVIYGKGVKDGVTREMGTALPNFVYEDMVDSRQEIDNLMGATSAFRGEREGQETKAGRLALIDQSYLALNELVQVGDYCANEMFNWFMQLAKVRYTEHHFAKEMGRTGAIEVISIMQDDIEDGTQVKVIPGKTLPEDRQFKFEQAQKDLELGAISPVDYFDVAGYDDPLGKARNAVKFRMNPAIAVGLSPEEMQQYAPPKQDDMPSMSISFKDLPPDGQVQLASKAGIELNPQILLAEKMAVREDKMKSAAPKMPVKSPMQPKM